MGKCKTERVSSLKRTRSYAQYRVIFSKNTLHKPLPVENYNK